MSKNQTSNSARGKRPMIKCSDFDGSGLTFSEMDFNNERSQQGISYPRYKYPNMDKESNLVYTTGEIKLTQYGLPSLKTNIKNTKLKSKWQGYENDKARGFIKVPIDPEQQSCVELGETLNAMDEVASEEHIKIAVFGSASKAKSFIYQPIVRKPQDEEEAVDEEEDARPVAKAKEKKERFNFVKLKLDREYETDKILTKVFIKRRTDEGFDLTHVEVLNETQLEKYLTWGSTIRMIVLVNKLWADAAKKNGNQSKMYGITQKIIQLEIQPKETSGSVREDLNEYAFEEVDAVTTTTKKATSIKSQPTNQKTTKPSSSSSNKSKKEESDNEEDQEEQADEVEDDETVEQEADEEQPDQEADEVEDEVEDPKPVKKGKAPREPTPKKSAPKKGGKSASSSK